MNHRLLLIPILLVAGLAGCKKSDEALMAEAKSTIIASCKTSATSIPNVNADQIEKFCTCSAENVVTSLGIEGVRALEERGSLSEEDQQKTQEASLACLDTLVAP